MSNPFVSGWKRPAPLIALAALLASCAPEGGAGKPAQMPIPKVGVLALQPQDVVMEIAVNGRVEATAVSEVRPQVDGIIRERLFAEGAVVKAGDLLYRIDPSVYQARHEKARAVLEVAKAVLAGAEAKAERSGKLAAREILSKQETELAETALAEARAQVAAAAADAESARIDLERTEVRAPIGGTVGKSAVTEGALVSASQAAPLAVIRADDEVKVSLAVPSAELARLRSGLASGLMQRHPDSSVHLTLDGGERYPIAGRVEFSEATVDRSTGTFALQASFPNPEGQLLPGMFVRAVVEQGVAKGVFRIPQRAVSRNPKGEATARFVEKEGVVSQRTLEVIANSRGDWIVPANADGCDISGEDGNAAPCVGASAGDHLVVEGAMNAMAGAKVETYPVSVDAETGLARPAGSLAAAPTNSVK